MTPTEVLFARILAQIPDANDPFLYVIPGNSNLSSVGFLVWTTLNTSANTPLKLYAIQVVRSTAAIEQQVSHDAIIASLQERLNYLRALEPAPQADAGDKSR